MQTRKFQAMGTAVELLVAAPPGESTDVALDAAEAEFVRLEEILSRFRAGSELAELNVSGSLRASDDLLTLTRLALDARTRTRGRFDPTVHEALVAAGYDCSFDSLAPDADAEDPKGARCGGGVTVDAVTGVIELEPGVKLDFGGIGKGYAADCASVLLALAGPCLVNAGGDIAVRGGSWPVGVETPDGTLTLELDQGAMATSGRDRRRWRRSGREHHHLIDPTTGRPATSDLLRVTVVAETAVEAEVLATSLFLAGCRDALREADAYGIPSVLVTDDGRTLLAGGLA